jgi:hypothetical protein
MATMTVCVRTILKFAPVRKYGRTSGLAENTPMTQASSGPRN